MTAQLQVLEFGEGAGHPFRGNQYSGGIGHSERTPSLRQSEERIRKVLPNAEVDLERHFEKFGMRVSDVPPVPMDRKLADITAGRIEKFAAEFPSAAATIAGVNMAEGATGYAQTNFATPGGDPVISLNPDFYPSEKTLEDGLTDPSWVGVAVATPEGVIDHELGHVLDFSRDAAYVDRMMGPGYYSGRTETFNEPSNMSKISEYAAQGGGPEAFAEAFALHQSGADIPVAKAERAIDSAVREAEQPHSNDHAPALAASGMVGGHTCEGFGPPPKTKRADLGEGAGHPFRGNQHTGGSGRSEGSGREQKMKAAEDRISKVIGGNLGPTAGAVPPDKRVDLTLMDPKLATEVADRVEVFAKEFPAAADRIGAVVTAPLEEGVRAETRVSPEGDLGILLNRDDYQDATTLRDVLGSPLNSTATFDTQGVIDHELGHVLDVMAPQNGSLGADTFWSDSQMENVSDYASTDPQEAVAEAFAVRQEGADAETVLPTAVERQITAAVDEVKTHPGEDRKEQASVFGSAFADWKPVCSGYPGKRITSYAAVQPLSFGDSAGHPFRGNQYTSGLSDNVDSSWRDVHPFSKEQQNWLREREQFYRDNDMLAPSNVAAGFHQHEDSDEAMRMRSAFYDQLGIPRTMDEHVDQFTRYDNKDVIAADREPTRAENDLAEEWLIHRDDAQYEHPNVGDQQVSVYRGGYSEQARSEPTGTVTELPINVLSSWTTDPATARDFGPVYKAQVDMKDVFHADPPNAGESEVIVFTDDLTRQAIRVDSTERGTRSGGPSMAASAEFGEGAGHAFRGNQYTGGGGRSVDPTTVHSIADLQRIADSGKLPPDTAKDQYFYHAVRYPAELNSILTHGLQPGPGTSSVFLSKDEVRDRGSGFAIVRVPTEPSRVSEGTDAVSPGLTYREFTTDQIPREDVVNVVRDVPSLKDSWHANEDKLAQLAITHQGEDSSFLPPEYQSWFHVGSTTAAVQPLEMGEHAGHPFRGNQWTDIGHGGIETRAIHYVEQLYNGEKVSIPADQVATVLDVIGRQAADAKAAGREARDINLCNASVEGANMFCSDSFGIPRQDMAQLAGDVVPGSQAALDNPGEKNIDATDKFLDSLRDQGVPFTRDTVPAQELKATQNELNGAKVAGIMNADMLDQERLFREPLVVSKENYILDGHHRWAAGIGLEYMDGKLDADVTANVYRVDAPITELMTDAKSFASSYGIKSEGIKSFTKGGGFSVVQVQILEFGEGHGHAFRGNQHTGGIGGEHDQLPLCPPSCHERELAVLRRDNLAIDGKFGDGMRPTSLQFEHTPERMGQWAPEREALHNEIVANALRAAEERGVPQESQMVLMGGLPGAGKSSATEDILDPKDWIMISPDDVKLQLAERGDIPTPDGMKPMEASPLVGDEAMKVSWDLADQATAQGYNVVWDMTGDDASWYSERIQNAQSTLPESEPYKTTGIFVDVPIEQSKDQVSSRYAKGAESQYGGRPVPQDYIERSRDPQYGSTQRRAFQEARDAGLLGQVMVIDNTDHKQQVVEKTPGFTLD